MDRTDWYARRDELEPGMVFDSCYGIVRLDGRTVGDGSDWQCDVWIAGRPDMPGTVYEKGHFSSEDMRIHPSDLTKRLPDDYNGRQPA